MELTFNNEKIKIKVKFYDSMIKLEGRYYLDKMPTNAGKHPMKYRKLKNGKVSVYAEFFIPNGFIYDALCIDDENTKSELDKWLTKLISDIAEQRGIEIPKKQEE